MVWFRKSLIAGGIALALGGGAGTVSAGSIGDAGFLSNVESGGGREGMSLSVTLDWNGTSDVDPQRPYYVWADVTAQGTEYCLSSTGVWEPASVTAPNGTIANGKARCSEATGVYSGKSAVSVPILDGLDLRDPVFDGTQVYIGVEDDAPDGRPDHYDRLATVGDGGGDTPVTDGTVWVEYEAHVNGTGWLDPVRSSATAGTVGQSLAMDALRIKLNGLEECRVEYQAHVQDVGWAPSRSDYEIAGTVDQSRRLEALRISLVDDTAGACQGYSIVYRAHVEEHGWLDWVADGETAGTEGEFRRMEAVQIRLVGPDDVTTNQLGMTFVNLPAGSFIMGSSRSPTMLPLTEITLPSFRMMTTEVTQAQWETIIGTNPSYWEDCSDCPVEQVSWDEVQYFITKLEERTGEVYRLPSEAEWEYAARAGTTTRYWWGDEMIQGYANCSGYNDGCFPYVWNTPSRPWAAGSAPSNPWGLYDMNGNVMEWVQDCGSFDHDGVATDGSARVTEACDTRMMRGGSYATEHTSVMAASRFQYPPDTRLSTTGFRLVRE